MQQRPKAIIIGAGVAGLAVSIRLSLQGFDVTIYERNSEPGGKLTALNIEGFHFDKGPSLFTQPQNLEEIFSLCGENISDFFIYKTCAVNCRYFFPDQTQIIAYADRKLLQNELRVKLEEPEENVEKYLNASESLYEKIAGIFLNFSLHKRTTWFHRRIIKGMKAIKFAYITKTLHQYNLSSFSNPKTVQIFNRYATYNGSNPYQAPAMLSVIAHLEYNEGSFYASGGMINITNALYKLAIKNGVRFCFNAAVEKILVSDNVATGIVANGNETKADYIISDIDVYYTYKNLLDNKKAAERVLQQERSSSALIFYWGISQEFPRLGLHNIFFTENYEEEFEYIFKRKEFYSDPTIYLNITSKEDKDHAPPGMENWFVMINVPAKANIDWQNFTIEARKFILTKLSRLLHTEIAPLIISELVMTPADIDTTTGSYLGSLYGTSSNTLFAAFLRHPNFSNTISKLYFCGGSVHPGGGIPLCLKSAKIVSDLIEENEKQKN